MMSYLYVNSRVQSLTSELLSLSRCIINVDGSQDSIQFFPMEELKELLRTLWLKILDQLCFFHVKQVSHD